MHSGYDVIVVGAGSAGCVLAARLSEDPSRSVLLIEAGPDYPDPTRVPPEILSCAGGPAFTHDWGYRNEPGRLHRSIELPRGRLVGGCSATNATAAVRGCLPSDYDEWASLGNAGWSFEEVLPFFRRLESDADFHDRWHGSEGPIPIRRYRPEEMTPVQRAFLESCWANGHPPVADHNAPHSTGAGPWPRNRVDEQRQSTAVTYLATARPRRNLTIRAGVLVDRVEFRGDRAVGIRTTDPAGDFLGERIVLAAGAFGSPAILLRSGVGPAKQVSELGLKVIEDRPGVGGNLVDHPLMGVRFAAPPSPAGALPSLQALLTFPSSERPAGHDLQVFPWSILEAAAESPTGAMGVLEVSLLKPRSRGSLRLRSTNPDAAPVIDEGLLTDPSDLSRFVHGVRVARRLLRTEPLSRLVVGELHPREEVPDTDEALALAVLAEVGTYFHPVGTCRMGPATDEQAVVDARGRVHGVRNVWVVDASIMPSIPGGNTNLPTIMVAERCAAWLAEGA